ncbi:TetR/AcrR family transcriptional regulator [Cohnella sp. 56]|uniref:TetR/AcrR family transcriptional regulator n=1 Tax=Cohnella sp. 56 TaxID=3113722 RepID=UPI0030E78925
MSRREEKKQAKHLEIIKNALRLFSEKGFDHVTTQEIADASGIAKKTLFQYFPTKDAIVFYDEHELLERVLEFIETVNPQYLWKEFKTFIIGIAGNDEAIGEYVALSQVIQDSPALYNRLMVMWATYERELAKGLLKNRLAGNKVQAQVWAVQMVLVLKLTFEGRVPLSDVFESMTSFINQAFAPSKEI